MRTNSKAISSLLLESKSVATATQVLQESDGTKAKSPNSVEPLAKSLVQYVRNGNTYSPVGSVVLADELGACAYEIKSTMEGIKFERVKPQTDDFMIFEDSAMLKVVEAIDKFWDRKQNFVELGLVHCRGIILHGPPGTGKSACLQQVVEMMVNRGDVVFFAKSADSILEGLRSFREVEPERRVVVCFEEAEEICNYGERTMLRLLDGDCKIGNVLYLATTNYLEQMSPRIKRPGRFDLHVHIGPPTMEARTKYLTAKLNNKVDETEIKRLAKETAGFGFGHLRELIAGAFALGDPVNEVLARLKGHSVTNDDRGGRSIGKSLASPMHESAKPRSVISKLLG